MLKLLAQAMIKKGLISIMKKISLMIILLSEPLECSKPWE